MTDASNSGFAGQQSLTDDTSDFNKMSFLIKQILGRISTVTLVRVMGVTNAGGIEPVGFVDVQPIVNLLDGAGNATPHATIYNIPYFRLQGGVNAVILDPVVGDIGLAVICDRDISSAKALRSEANPGSRRRFDLADGVYLGGVLNVTPTCYVAFTGGGITMSPDSGTTSIVLTPGMIKVTADEVVTIGRNKNIWGTNGAGFIYQPNQIDTYTQGVPSNDHAPPVPES